MYSLRRTLAVRFSLTIFVALLLIALWAYFGTRRVVRRELDKGLAAASQLEAAALAAGLPIPLYPGPPVEDEFVETVNRFVAVRNEAGAVVATNTPFAGNLPLDRTSFDRARQGERVWVTETWKGQSIRSFYAPGPARTSPDKAVIQVSASLRPMGAASREVLFFMLGTVLLGTAATAFGAGWLARSAISPVAEITEQAELIGAESVAQQITAHEDVEEFAGLVDVLNSMLDRLKRAYESQRRMIADAGHDLRTPITAMRGELEVALRGTRTTDDYIAALKSLLEEVDHLGSISDALFLLARLETGEITPAKRDIEIRHVVEGAAARIRSRAGDRRVRVTSGDHPTAAVDEKMLSVVVDHLLDNAVRHTPPETNVAVSVQSGETDVTIAVEDDGPGIPARERSHLFERFYRGDAARSRAAGAGLGLTIAAAITKAHSGTITADQSPLGGLKLTITLPRGLN